MIKKNDHNSGLTLIELLIVVAIITIFILVLLLAYRAQLAKGRDGKRKTDLNKIQKILEDYLNDKDCYPNADEITEVVPSFPDISSICNKDFYPYLSHLPCDPMNNTHYNYYYSVDDGTTCKKWYKIYTKLEDTEDPVIEKVGCKTSGCGPSNNYNYWVSSPNVATATKLPGESWPRIPGVPPAAEGTPTLPIVPTASPSPTGLPVTLTPTVTPPFLSPTPTATPVVGPGCGYYGCFSGVCRSIPDSSYCSPNYIYCGLPVCSGDECCFNSCKDEYGVPKNECILP